MLLLQDVAVLLLQESGRGAVTGLIEGTATGALTAGVGMIPGAAIGVLAGAIGGAVMCTMTPTP